jgi:type VI secretion system secreted protein Hcp
MDIRLGVTAAAMALMVVAAPGAALAAVDAFLKIDTIPGEANEPGHAGEIELMSWSFGGSPSQTAGMGNFESPTAAALIGVHEIRITKRTDKASPLLRQALATRRLIPMATLNVRKMGGDEPVLYRSYTLRGVMITGLQASGSGDRPTESVSLNFTKIEFRNVGMGAQRATLPPPGRPAPQ